MSTDMDTAGTTDRRKRRRTVVVLKFGLAGAALLGIGLAATSAAWSDNAWFSATANGANAGTKVELDASVNGTSWSDADDGTVAVAVDAAAFKDLVPNKSVDVTLYLKNVGTNPINVATAVVTPSGDLFGPGGAVATVTGGAGSLAAGASTTATLTVKAGDWGVDPVTGAPAFSASTGSLTVQFTGTAVAP